MPGPEGSAFDELVARWDRSASVGRSYRVFGRDPTTSAGPRQEAFLKAYRALGTFKREARFSSWLYQIAINLRRDRLRRAGGGRT